MKATGIVRRIDDLGRVVIPKEIRRTLRIRFPCWKKPKNAYQIEPQDTLKLFMMIFEQQLCLRTLTM